MKVKLKLMRRIKENIANVVAFTGVTSILYVVAFATTNDIPVGEMAYQKLWLGRMSFIFLVCFLVSFCLDKKLSLRFPSFVTWSLIILGGIEAAWGLGQIYGLVVYMHLRALSIIRDLIRDI